MKKRVHAFYSGDVQGVGFRFTVMDLANSYAVAGWVKNLRDGRVEITAEGDEERLIEFLEKIKTGSLQRYISNIALNWQDYRGEFKGFNIEF